MRLVYKKTGEPVQLGDIIPMECTDGRTGARVTHFRKPHKPSSGGKVRVDLIYGDDDPRDDEVLTREYYVSVIGAHWIEREDCGEKVSKGEGEPGEQMSCEFCGYTFDAECGRYGCPNCLGEGLFRGKQYEYFEKRLGQHGHTEVIGWREMPPSSVLAGQLVKCFLASFETEAEAEKVFGSMGWFNQYTAPQTSVDHLPDGPDL